MGEPTAGRLSLQLEAFLCFQPFQKNGQERLRWWSRAVLHKRPFPDPNAGLAILECGYCSLKRSFVRLTVDPHRVQPPVAQPRRHCRQVDRLDQAPRGVVAKAMRVHIRDVGAPAWTRGTLG
jgi:hypothetical protein